MKQGAKTPSHLGGGISVAGNPAIEMLSVVVRICIWFWLMMELAMDETTTLATVLTAS